VGARAVRWHGRWHGTPQLDFPEKKSPAEAGPAAADEWRVDLDVHRVAARAAPHAAARFRFGLSLNSPRPVWTTRPSGFFASAYSTE
jgi:hypothetical protein